MFITYGGQYTISSQLHVSNHHLVSLLLYSGMHSSSVYTNISLKSENDCASHPRSPHSFDMRVSVLYTFPRVTISLASKYTSGFNLCLQSACLDHGYRQDWISVRSIRTPPAVNDAFHRLCFTATTATVHGFPFHCTVVCGRAPVKYRT